MRSLPLVVVAGSLLALVHGAACSSSDSADPPPGGGTGTSGASGASGGTSGTSGTSGSSGSSGSSSGADASSGGTDSGGDGAAADPLSTDRGLFFGASRCAAAGLMFCEDFETTLDPTRWTGVGTPKPTIDATQHARGAKALHVSITGNGASYIKTTKPFPAPMNKYWGRAFIRFGKLPGAPLTYSHWTFAAATGKTVDGEIRLSGQLQNGKNLFGVGTDNRTQPAGTGDWTNSDKDPKNAPRAVPVDEWMCIEWEHAGNINETHFYWDAVEHPSLATTATSHGGNTNPYIMPTFDTVWVGWQEYQPTTLPFEMWVDEVAFDPNRIGCVR